MANIFFAHCAQPNRMTGDERSTAADGGHVEPAALDWPKGEGEMSVWPLVTAVGVAGLYAGAGLYLLGHGEYAILPGWLGPVGVAFGLGGFLTGAFGWLWQGFVERYYDRDRNPHASLTLRVALGLFLVTEVATFGAGFGYYFWIRAGEWPPADLPHLLGWLVYANTAVLVTSSGTLHYAEKALERGDRARFVQLLAATVGLGLVFLAGQAYEYYEFVVKESYTLASGIFASAFFGLTGLHGLHVTFGVTVLSVVLVRAALLGQYTDRRLTSVNVASVYWHFVDAVWLFLVLVLYVGGSIPYP